MLKQTLTEYMEQFAILKAQQNDFLQQGEARYQQDKRMLEAVQIEVIMSNKALTDSIDQNVESMSANIRLETIAAVTSGLQKSQAAFDKAIASIDTKEAAMLKKMDVRHKTIEQNIRQMFDFDTVKQWVFWGSCICNVLVLILLLFW